MDATGSFLIGIGAALAGTLVIGMILERTLLRYTYGRYGALLQLLLTFGIAELIRGLVILVWGRTGKNFATPSWGSSSIDLMLFTYPAYRVFVIAAAAVLIVAVYLFLTQTDLGLLIRAGTQDREMVDMLGIDVSRLYMLVFGIGVALAGTAGALIGPVRGAYPTLGIELLIPAFVVVVIGGLGSFTGAFVGAYLIGLMISLGSIVAAGAGELFPFVAMILVLMFKPQGLFGGAEA